MSRDVRDIIGDLPWIDELVRAGWVSRGVVYVVVGLTAFSVAFQSAPPDNEASPSGALGRIAEHPAGRLLLAVVVLGTGVSRAVLVPLMEPLVAALGIFSDASGPELSRTVQKSGHFVAFFALTSALWWWRRRLAIGVPSIVLLGIAIAIGTEALQLYVDGRSPRLTDVVIDVVGIGSALLCVAVARPLFRRGTTARIAAEERSG